MSVQQAARQTVNRSPVSEWRSEPAPNWRRLHRAAARSIDTLRRSADVADKRRAAIAAGCQLREAYLSYLHGQCVEFDCMPKDRRDRTPLGLALQLKKAGHLHASVIPFLTIFLNDLNKLAHCHFVPARRMEWLATRLTAAYDFLP